MTRALPGVLLLLATGAAVVGVIHERDGHRGLRIIDLRSDSAYAAGHIPIAEHMSLSQLQHARFRRDEVIMLYSDGGGEAAKAWVSLRASGLVHVYSLSGGAGEWADRRKWRGGC